MRQTSIIPTKEKANTFKYLLTKFNEEGWADAKKHLPIPFDLVTVQTNTDKKIAAWWNQREWKGCRLSDEDQVLFWERRLYENII